MLAPPTAVSSGNYVVPRGHTPFLSLPGHNAQQSFISHM